VDRLSANNISYPLVIAIHSAFILVMEQVNGIKAIHFKTRSAWRQWLSKNHDKEKAVWLILHNKNSEAAGMRLEDAVMEALCFGWIDSKAMKRDEVSRYQYFCPRKHGSNWSKVNRDRVERLIQDGLMTPAGEALIEIAKKRGTWDAMVEVENEVIPEDLQKRFDRNKKALKNFLAFAPSSRRVILQWILHAKRPDTRKVRIEKTVMLAAKNLKAYP